MSNSTQRNKIRNTLLDNGYRPLPLLDKGIRIKGWSTATIDADWLAQFERNGKYQNTGIRCDDLLAFDIDVLDEKLADGAEVLIEKICGPTGFCRVGKWPKRLLLYRVDTPGALRSCRTPKYADQHQVELLTGSGRQFAAFGIHPGTGEPYEWLDGYSPDIIPFEDAPALSWETASSCMIALEDYFENVHGLERTRPGNVVGASGMKLYDLTDDTPFMLDGVETTWSALKDTLTETGVWANAMRENGEYGDSDGVHCYIAKGSQQPCAHDFPRDCTHFDEIISQDAIKLFPDPPDAPMQIVPPDKSVLDDMLVKWVLLNDQTMRRVNHPLREYSVLGMKTRMKAITVLNNANPPKAIPVMDMWLSNPNKLSADYAQLRPDHPDAVLIDSGEETAFNTYRRPEHPKTGGDYSLKTLFEFIEHLIPKADEREIFYDWHALKVQNPGWRMHGLVMVTQRHGTGRGQWFQIVEKLFGIQYVKNMEYDDLIGHTSQSTYNEYFANSLVVTVEEVFEKTANKSDWETRRIAYERVKTVCEPIARPMHIKRKYGRNSTEIVYASMLISSNHDDALAIDPDDRRIIVLDNTDTRLEGAPNDLHGRIELWKHDPANIGALYHWLEARAAAGVKYNPFVMPPDTAAKRRMIDAGQSDMDHIFEAFVEQCEGDVCVPYQWRAFVLQESRKGIYSLPDNNDAMNRMMNTVISQYACRFDDIGSGQIKVNGVPDRPWIIRHRDKWKGNTNRRDWRDEIDKNGATKADVSQLIPGR